MNRLPNDDCFNDPTYEPSIDDIVEENRRIRKELLTLSGYVPDDDLGDETDPVKENKFLKHVLMFEKVEHGPTKPVASFIPAGFELTAAAELSDEEVTKKLDDLCAILAEHNISVDLQETLPDRIAYHWLITEGIHDLDMFDGAIPGFTMHIDGCSGGCPECFQGPWCESGKEMYPNGYDREPAPLDDFDDDTDSSGS